MGGDVLGADRWSWWPIPSVFILMIKCRETGGEVCSLWLVSCSLWQWGGIDRNSADGKKGDVWIARWDRNIEWNKCCRSWEAMRFILWIVWGLFCKRLSEYIRTDCGCLNEDCAGITLRQLALKHVLLYYALNLCCYFTPSLRRVRKIAKSDYWVRHVHSSSWNNSAPVRRILMKYDIWAFFENLSR